MAFTQQELKDAYKQMQVERKAEGKLAALAAEKLSQALGGQRVSYRRIDVSMCRGFHPTTPCPANYEIFFELYQYDDWQNSINALNNLGCNMAQRMVVGWGKRWCGEYDLSNDPDFAAAHQKVYRVAIDNYDAHVGGY